MNLQAIKSRDIEVFYIKAKLLAKKKPHKWCKKVKGCVEAPASSLYSNCKGSNFFGEKYDW